METETRIFFQCELTGCAAEMVMNKIKEKQHGGISKFGKQRAVQSLLCELWQKKNNNVVIGKNDTGLFKDR